MSNYTKDFLASPLKFMKKYAISPPSNVQGDQGTDVQRLDTSGFTPNHQHPHLAAGLHSLRSHA